MPGAKAAITTQPEVLDAQSWNETVVRAGGSFLQSSEWGTFQRSLGREIVRLSAPSFVALLIKHELPLGGSYLYCPRGPVSLQSAGLPAEGLANFVDHVRALESGAVFLKIEPEWPSDTSARDVLGGHGFTQSRTSLQPSSTLMLDLSQPEEQILAGMKKGRRYDIRLAERKGVSARKLGLEERDTFLQMLAETARRDRFRIHPPAYYREMLEQFEDGADGKPFVELWGAEYAGELLAINLVLFWGERMTYLHAASSSKHRDVMAPAFLQWRVLNEAKRRGYKAYDLWGISEAWIGVTRFKKAFGGAEVNYVGSYELALQPFRYRIYALLQTLRARL